MMGVGDELLCDGIASSEVVGDDADGEGFVIDVVEVVLEVALFFVEEGLFVGEEQLQVAGLGPIDGGVLALVERAVRSGEPDATGGSVGGRDCIFFAGGPTRVETGATEGRTIIVQPVVCFVQSTHIGYSTTSAAGMVLRLTGRV